VAQNVRERLLLGRDGASPQIAGYRGAGPLRSWVAIAASTQLAMARRSEQRRRELPPAEADGAAADLIAGDPELGYLRDRYRVEAEQAIAHALSTLGDRERVLLRLQLGDRLTLEQLAALYGVNRATVVRWLAKARSQLLEGIRRELCERTGAAADTCDSLLRLVHSQLDVSVLRHLT
jgi:RNA polymerase sigma-70 factor, ECF subfamily